MHPKVLPASSVCVWVQARQGSAGMLGSLVVSLYSLVHGWFSSLPETPACPSYLFHSIGVVYCPLTEEKNQ